MAQQTARWFFRSRSWVIPSNPCISSCTLLRCGTSGLGCGLELHQGLQALGLQAFVNAQYGTSFLRSYSAQPTALVPGAMAEKDATKVTSSPASARLGLPTWLRNLLPGAKDLLGSSAEATSSASRQAASQPAEDSSSGVGDSTDAEDLKQLAEMRNMTMEGYVEYCKKMRSGSTPPRPRRPPVPRGHYDYTVFQDMRRIAFLRLQQHERIGSLVTKDEGEIILAQREEVLRNRALLETIADRTGVYIDLEVKDCIQQFLETRQRAERIHRFVTEFGMSLPKTAEEQKYARQFMVRKEAEAELSAAIARRDTATCPLRHKLPWAGATARCDLTGLRYFECCGRATAGAEPQSSEQLHLPNELLRPKRNTKNAWVDKDRERSVYRKFKSRAEGRLRKAYLTASKPRFRDY